MKLIIRLTRQAIEHGITAPKNFKLAYQEMTCDIDVYAYKGLHLLVRWWGYSRLRWWIQPFKKVKAMHN